MIQRIVIGLDHNAERPADAVELLRLAASHLDMMAQEYEHRNKVLQPFLVRDTVVDMYSGTITLYIEWQKD